MQTAPSPRSVKIGKGAEDHLVAGPIAKRRFLGRWQYLRAELFADGQPMTAFSRPHFAVRSSSRAVTGAGVRRVAQTWPQAAQGQPRPTPRGTWRRRAGRGQLAPPASGRLLVRAALQRDRRRSPRTFLGARA